MAVTEYTGARYVPIFGRIGEESIQWDNSKEYEPLTIVLHEGNSFTSRQYVPVGIDIDNAEFWAETGNYNAQIEQYRQEVMPLINANLINRMNTAENRLDIIDSTIIEAAKQMPEYSSLIEYQCRAPQDTSLQGFCFNEDTNCFYALHRVPTTSQLYLTIVNLGTDSYRSIELSFTGHGNTVCVSKNNTLIISSNTSNYNVYEIDINGILINTFTTEYNEMQIVYSDSLESYYGHDRDKIYKLDDEFNVIESHDLAVHITVLCNAAINGKYLYASDRENKAVYIYDCETFKLVDAFIVNESRYTEFEGVCIKNGEVYSGIAHYYVAATTFNRVYNNANNPYEVYCINKRLLNVVCNATYTNAIANGTQEHPFLSMGLALTNDYFDCSLVVRVNNEVFPELHKSDITIDLVNYLRIIGVNSSIDFTHFYIEGPGKIFLHDIPAKSLELYDGASAFLRNANVTTFVGKHFTQLSLYSGTITSAACEGTSIFKFGGTIDSLSGYYTLTESA